MTLDDLAAAEALEHEGSCCHPEDREWRRDTTARQVCACSHGLAEHAIDTPRMRCSTTSCPCPGFTFCHAEVREHRTRRQP